ncbi:MAG TPA: hypothetical protein VN106_11925 [Sphingomicrobium sp.]|nr:hypothetical protein [Sphingomicrobium sp.]
MSGLRELVAEELMLPVDVRVTEIASAIAAEHGSASRAVLFYGSCLRQRELDGMMLDFYLIVSDYREAYRKRWLAAANRLVPPNVFYFEHGGLVSKYAVLSEADFAHECSSEAWTVSTAARFAQPSRLVWVSAPESRERIVRTVETAVRTLLAWIAPTLPPGATRLETWKRAFALTFGAELRAERVDRSAQIVDADPGRYETFAAAAGAILPSAGLGSGAWWRGKQRKGKLYSIARLAKASFTFAGGADYIAWKINRHAGTAIELKPWQRRHPLLAAVTLLPRLLGSGAVR